MGPRQIADFEREAVRAVRALVGLPGETAGQRLTIKVAGQTISGLRVRDARVEFSGWKKEPFEAFKRGEGTFEDLRQLDAIEVDAFLDGSDLQEFADRELARIKPEKLLIRNLRFTCGKGDALVSGSIDIFKILPGFFSFLPKWSSSFTARVAVRIDGGRILIEPSETTLNGQPMNAEVEKKLLEWLNPVWDNGALPYPAALERVEISPEGISFAGWLFSR